MKTVSSNLQSHLNREVTAVCTCWEIVRNDGERYFFTDSDFEVTVGGITYVAFSAYQRTAVESTATLSVDNLDIVGASSDVILPADDLKNGLFDGASIRIFLTSWVDANGSQLKIRSGLFGEVTLGTQNTYKVELRGLSQKLSQPYIDIFSPTCLYDLGDSKCGVRLGGNAALNGVTFDAGETAQIPQTQYALGKYHSLEISSLDFPNFVNGESINNSLYWHMTNGEVFFIDKTDPFSGDSCIRGGTGTGTASQYVNLDDLNVDNSSIDSGSCFLTFRVWCFGGDCSVSIHFFDNEFSTIGSTTQVESNIGNVWKEVEFTDVSIPANTRTIRFDLTASGGNTENVKFDAVSGFVIDQNGPIDFLSYTTDNVIWVCDTPGVSQGFFPANVTAGETIGLGALGSAPEFTAENSFTRSGRVIAVTDNRNFRAVIAEPRAVDGWFNGGIITFETGENAGKSIEVKNWKSLQGNLELFLSTEFPITVGDMFSINPGCDKTRVCCAAMFSNVKNMFGFPDVPGQDELLKYPDAR